MIPKEPVDIRQYALQKIPEWSPISRKSVINLFVLSAGFLPKYLWRNWQPTLKEQGIPWQLFLKAISACEYDVNAWVEGSRSWKDLVTIITKVLDKARKEVYPLWPP